MGSPEKLMVFLLCIFNFVLVTVSIECIHHTIFLPRDTVYWFSASPMRFSAGDNCVWKVKTSLGTNIRLNCTIQMPITPKCWGDKLMVSVNGDRYMSDASYHCGNKSFSILSKRNSMAVELKGLSRGTFHCNYEAVSNITECDCGWGGSTRIMNGNVSDLNEYPAVAAIIDAEAKLVCGSTILSNRYVLTAAHCLMLKNAHEFEILVGVLNITAGIEDPTATRYEILEYIIHPNFDNDTKQNDIAIIRTLTEIDFSLSVGPVCLPVTYIYNHFDYQNVILLGWGELFLQGPLPGILQKVTVPVVPRQFCRNPLLGDMPNSQICTYTDGQDACKGDSGGPILWKSPRSKRMHIIGVISYGYACGVRPSVHTRVTSFLSWIIDVIADIGFCVKH